MNTAIIVAAGRGSRFGSEIPKQFVPILGKPLIVHTLERFEICTMIDEVILVLPAEYIDRFEELARGSGLTKLRRTVAGGETRAESVRNGLASIGDGAKVVAIHDGARPLVSPDEIRRTIEAAAKSGAACLVTPVTDTVKEVRGGQITRTIDRSDLRRALTPQAFRIDVIRAAFDGVTLGETVTDDCYLVEKKGQEVVAVEGSPLNIKITHPEDLSIAEVFLNGGFQ